MSSNLLELQICFHLLNIDISLYISVFISFVFPQQLMVELLD